MSSTYRKKLVEVALPLEVINAACVEDKNRKTGHIRNLHKWFAPMPLPAWRAVLFASLVDDPSNDLTDDLAAIERHRLFHIIERLVPFDAIYDRTVLEEAQSEIRKVFKNDLPTIVDPFCGGGSTIVEAQRLGLPTFASDLNPIPVLITKMLTEIPPKVLGIGPCNPNERNGRLIKTERLEGFISDLRYYADLVRKEAWNKIGQHFSPHSDGSTIVAWRWARTVASPDPRFRGAHTPLISDWWLSKKHGAKAWIEPVIQNDEPFLSYRVSRTGTPPSGTTGRNGAKCVLSGAPIPLEYIRKEGKAKRLGVHLLAFVTTKGGRRHYESPSDSELTKVCCSVPDGIPNIPLPEKALGFRVQEYGFESFRDLFADRQLLALDTFAGLVHRVRDTVLRDAIASGRKDVSNTYADAVVTMLALCVGKLAQSNNALARWYIDARNGAGQALPAFDRHAIPMIWDFTEVNPFGGSVGDWINQVNTAIRALDLVEPSGPPSVVCQLDARDLASKTITNPVVATDPPYYGNIGYADLSDFFYMWVRKALRQVYPDLLSTVATPKDPELIATPFRHNGSAGAAKAYFRTGFEEVFSNIAAFQTPSVPISIVYAFKQEEEDDEGSASTGWEAMLEGLMDANLVVVSTWPLRTNRATRMIGIGTNSLASAILILCRPRSVSASVGSRRDFLQRLREELPKSLGPLKHANIAPVDLAQVSIGPGMAIFSGYAKILESDGSPMSVRTALSLINQALDEVLAEQEGEFDTDTCWALAWFDQYGFDEGPYGVAETLSKAKNTSVTGMVEAGILSAKGGKVRLLKKQELEADWVPERDKRLTIWEALHHLIRSLEQSESSAALLLNKIGLKAEVARDLAYRLFAICERRKRAQEALVYNTFVLSWTDIVRLAQQRPAATGLVQPDLVQH